VMQSNVIYQLHYKILNFHDTKASRRDLLKKFGYTIQLYSNKYPKGKSEEATGN
jgi:hypothetical protein